MAGFKSLLRWLAAGNTGASPTQAGFRSIVGRWAGGLSAQGGVQAGWRSVAGRWVGGLSAQGGVQAGWRSVAGRWVGGLSAAEAGGTDFEYTGSGGAEFSGGSLGTFIQELPPPEVWEEAWIPLRSLLPQRQRFYYRPRGGFVADGAARHSVARAYVSDLVSSIGGTAAVAATGAFYTAAFVRVAGEAEYDFFDNTIGAEDEELLILLDS